MTDQFVVLFLDNHTQDAAYAVHIRKRFGNAVERNRAKRVFRASLRQLKEMIRGVDLIVIPRRGGKGLGVPGMAPLLEKSFAKAGLSQER